MACALAEDKPDPAAALIPSGRRRPLWAILMAAVLDLVPPAERGRRLAYVAWRFPGRHSDRARGPRAGPVVWLAGEPSSCLVLAACCWPCCVPSGCRPAGQPGPGRPGGCASCWSPLPGSPSSSACRCSATSCSFRTLPTTSSSTWVSARADCQPLSVRRRPCQHGHHAPVRRLDRSGAAPRRHPAHQPGPGLITLVGFALPAGLPLYLLFTSSWP